MKFKEYIQSEINQKEVEPSHDAFDRIQARLGNQQEIVPQKSATKWWAVAATVIGLAVCTTIYFTQNNSSDQAVQFTQQDDVHPSAVEDENSVVETSIQDQQMILADATSKESVPVKSNESAQSTEEVIEKASPEIANTTPTQNVEVEKNVVSPKIEKPALANGLKQNPTQLATNLDTVKVNKKKGNYVDPNMLLYSIENKEAIKETNNQRSRVAVIDLNK